MGWLNNLFGSKRVTITSDQLKIALKSSCEDGDMRLFGRICQAHQDDIKQFFAYWQVVPGHTQFDQESIQRHMNFLVPLAQFFATTYKDDSLMRCLVGTAKSNPLIKWQQDLQQIQEMITRLEFKEAQELLTNRLIDFREISGTGKDHYSAITHALLGQCFFENGEVEQAPGYFEAALDLCRKNQDADGMEIYLENLFEIFRYLDRPDCASAYAQELSELLSSTGKFAKSARFHRRAEIVRAGEPLNRVVAWIDDQVLEIDDIDCHALKNDQNVQFIFERNRVTLRPALQLVEQGKKCGSEGEYEEALGYFQQAASTDRFDPDCHFQEGFTFLKLKRYAEAVDSLIKTEELAPGWFRCRADRWLAERLSSGEFLHEHFLGLVGLEDYKMAPIDRVRLADCILEQVPHFAAISLVKGKTLRELEQWSEAEAALRQGLANADEPDVRTRLLADLGVLVEDVVERRELLQQAVELNGNLVSAAGAKLALRQLSP